MLPGKGYRVVFEPDGTFTIVDRQKGGASTVYPGNKLPDTIRIKRNGQRIEVSDGEKVFLAMNTSRDFDGGLIAFRGIRGFFTGETEVTAGSDSSREFTFDTVPVEWSVADGNWGTMNRWVCNPTWSYFGGKSQHLAAIWLKEKVEGNLAVDFYAGFSMPGFTRLPLEKPSSLGITLYGNGKDPVSGKSFLIGADLNETGLMFEGREEYERVDNLVFKTVTNRAVLNMEFHRHWVHIQLVCVEGELIVKIADSEVYRGKYEPDKLSEGFVGLWTLDNAILIARANVTASRMSPAPPVKVKTTIGTVGAFHELLRG
ncbi:MAG: hypothetical protein U5N86_12605 [Planctomycetota bacterium]|nr:hypothetical protein [Planctomycetota bacterium]